MWPARLSGSAHASYNGPAETAVRGLKYLGWRHLATVCARLMVDLTRRAGVDRLVPVPLHPTRERERGFNQAREIACALGAATGLEVRDELIRVAATRSQVGLGRAERRANVSGAFAPVQNVGRGVVGLVDDVTTSGATFIAAGTALLEAGVERVHAIAFALATDPERQ